MQMKNLAVNFLSLSISTQDLFMFAGDNMLVFQDGVLPDTMTLLGI